jgi:glutaconate CoA-transferase subunit A
MAEIVTLRDAVSALIHDGDSVAMEGFTHLIPFAAGHEVIRQQRRDLTLIRMTPDVIFDQLIGAGCATRLVFSWGGNPGVGSLHRLRDAVEHEWPHPLALDEHSHAGLASAYVAGASNLPFAVLRGYAGTDLPKYNDNIRTVRCPFTGEELAAVQSVRPDVAVIHAQKADRKGNVLLWGILGVQKEAVLSAQRSIVTVEEVVDDLHAWPNAALLPSWVISAVCVVPRGAHPSYAQGYYERDNHFYQTWDAISRSREGFTSWLRRHVYETADFAEFLRVLSESKEGAGG